MGDIFSILKNKKSPPPFIWLILRIENLSPIGFCTYSWLRRLKFCFQIHNNVYYPILKKKFQSPPTRRRTAVSKLKTRRFSTFCLYFTIYSLKNSNKKCPRWFQEYSKPEFTGGRPPPPPPQTAARRRTKIPKRWQIYRYGYRFWGYLGRWFRYCY